MDATAIGSVTFLGDVRDIAKESLNTPWSMVTRIFDGIKIDATRIKKAGLPGVAFGLPLAVVSLPLVPLTVPASIAGRAAAACDSPIGKTIGGIGGFVLGAAITGWFAEGAIFLHLGEVMCWTGRAYERVEKKREAEALQKGDIIIQQAMREAAATTAA